RARRQQIRRDRCGDQRDAGRGSVLRPRRADPAPLRSGRPADGLRARPRKRVHGLHRSDGASDARAGQVLMQSKTGGTTVTMPQLGETVTEGTVAQWLKRVGDSVEKYEPFVEVSTDKVNAEIPAPVSGRIREILVREGQTVPTGAPIAIIDTSDGAPATEGNGKPEAPADR